VTTGEAAGGERQEVDTQSSQAHTSCVRTSPSSVGKSLENSNCMCDIIRIICQNNSHGLKMEKKIPQGITSSDNI
jgi:hypothetical protein